MGKKNVGLQTIRKTYSMIFMFTSKYKYQIVDNKFYKTPNLFT